MEDEVFHDVVYIIEIDQNQTNQSKNYRTINLRRQVVLIVEQHKRVQHKVLYNQRARLSLVLCNLRPASLLRLGRVLRLLLWGVSCCPLM